MATNFYVDGPNLYYAALRNNPVRWLDVARWCQQLFPGEDVKRVRFFTAWPRPVRERGQTRRFQAYVRALQSSPKVSLHFGRGHRGERSLPDPTPPATHRVRTSRLKGVDVALASAMLVDAARRDCDTVVVVSNDSDLRPALKAARRGLGVRVGLVNPRRRIGRDMAKLVDFYVEAPQASYASALFPREMTDANGPFHAPERFFLTDIRK